MANAGGGATGPSSSSSPLDGAFLLQILRNPPQSHHQQQQQSQPKPLPFLPHEALNPQRDPAVSAVVPTYPSSPHSLLRPQDAPPVHFSPPVPSFFPPVFSRDHQRAPPGFGSSPPVYRGDFLDKFATNHWRGEAGGSGSRNFDSWKDRGWSSADRSNFVHRPHGVSGNRRDVNHNVYYNQREGDGQSSLHLQQRELVGIRGSQIDVREQHNQLLDQYRDDFGRKYGLVEELIDDDLGSLPDDFDDLREQLGESLVVGDETSEGHVAKTSTRLRSKMIIGHSKGSNIFDVWFRRIIAGCIRGLNIFDAWFGGSSMVTIEDRTSLILGLGGLSLAAAENQTSLMLGFGESLSILLEDEMAQILRIHRKSLDLLEDRMTPMFRLGRLLSMLV